MARLVAWSEALVFWFVRRGDRRHHAAVFADRALRELDQGHANHAIRTSEYAIAADPAYLDGYRALAVAHLTERHLDEARDAARRGLALPRGTGSLTLLGVLGDADFGAGDYRGAEGAYRRALGAATAGAARADFLFRLGAALLRQGRLEEAADQFVSARELDPGDERALGALGEARARQGRHEEAIRWLAGHLARQPAHAASRYYLAYSLGKLGRWEEAAEQAKRATELEPSDTTYRAFSMLADHEVALQRRVRESDN